MFLTISVLIVSVLIKFTQNTGDNFLPSKLNYYYYYLVIVLLSTYSVNDFLLCFSSMKIQFTVEMDRWITYLSTQTASAGDIQVGERKRERCEDHRQNMTSIPAHVHTRHRSVHRQRECDECINSVHSQASPQIHVKLRTADKSPGVRLVRQ